MATPPKHVAPSLQGAQGVPVKRVTRVPFGKSPPPVKLDENNKSLAFVDVEEK